MPVLRHEVRRPGGTPARGFAAIFLAAPGKGDVGYVPAGPYSVEGVTSVQFDEDGVWEVELVGNDAITNPAGSRWLIIERVDRLAYVHTVYLPVNGGPYDLETVAAMPPDSLPEYRSILRTEGIVAVQHGADATVERPVAAIVWWVGTVQPEEMAAGDVWHNPDGLTDPLLQALYEDDSILVADADNTPFALAVPDGTVPGRPVGGGGWAALGGVELQAVVGSTDVARVELEVVNNTTVQAPVPDLDFVGDPNTEWSLRYIVRYRSGSTADLRCFLNATGDVTGDGLALGLDPGQAAVSASVRFQEVVFGSLFEFGAPAGGAPHWFTMDVYALFGPAGGSLHFTFAQRSPEAVTTAILAGTSRRIAIRA